MSPNARRRRRRLLLTVEAMERRELLSGAPVLFTSGALASQPTWGQTPTPPNNLPLAVNSFFSPESVITKDINGNPIDFNKDGYSDLIETGQAMHFFGYGTQTSMLVDTSQGIFGKVAFGGPNGPVFSDQGFQAGGSVTVQFQGEMAAVADLNGDGYQDILTTASNSTTAGSGFHTVEWLFNPQQQTFTRVVSPTTINGWCDKTGQMTLGDVTGDGVPDLVMPNFSTTPVPSPKGSGNNVLPMIGFQVFAGVTDPSAGRWIGDFAAAPISTVTLKQPSAEWGLRTGQSAPYTTTSPYGTISVVNSVLADLNGDGKLDLAIPEADGVTVFPNPGNGQFVQASGVFTQSSGSANGLNLVAGDFNNDGKLDLATSPNYVSSCLRRDHPGPSFTVWTASQAPVSVYLNTTPSGGPISFSTNAVNAFEQLSGWNGTIALGDFNGDGNLDIAVASGRNQSTQYGIVEGDGTGNFGPLALYQGYTNNADGYDDNYQRAIDYLAVSDFNKDGQPDIVTTALNIGTVGSPLGNDALEAQNNEAVGITGISYNKTFALPGVSPLNPPVAVVGQPYTLQLTGTNGDPTKPFVFALDPRSVPLPAGLTMSSTGLISGTPTQPGPFQLTLDVSQPSGPRGPSPVYVLVNPTAPVVLNVLPQSLPGGMVNQFYSQQVSATGGTGAVTFSLISGQLPYGLTLSPAGLISGVPTMSGNFGFSVYAVDSGTGSGSRSYSVTIGSNQPITFQTGPLPQSTVNQPYSQMITAVGGNGGPYTYTVTQGALPPGVTLTTGGLLAGTPTALGNYAFTLTAAAGGVMASQGYVVKVVPVLAQPPIVIGLTRIGVNTLAVAFSQPMKASGAQSIRNYVLSTAGPDGVWGTKDDYVIALRPPFYNAVTQTTTITTACGKFPLNWLYRLVIKGVPPAGVSNAQGVFLGGRGADQPGTDYVRTFRGKEIPYVVPS